MTYFHVNRSKKENIWHIQKEKSPLKLPELIPAVQTAHSFSYILYSKRCEKAESVWVTV